MKKVTIDSIDLTLSVDEELCLGTLKILLTPKGEIFMPSTNLEEFFSKEEYKDLKNQIIGKLGLTFHEEMEVGTEQ